MATGNGYLIPGEVMQGNCIKIFFQKKQYAVVKSEISARLVIQALTMVMKVSTADFHYEIAFIEGVGF